MQLNLGTKIRELRRRDGRTQDNLAEVLGVTAQAVSRWESGGSYPDMEMIPAIANYFGVSIDELFGYDNVREKRIDEIVERLTEMNKENNGIDVNVDDCIQMARTALAEFPANEKILLCLAQILVTAGYVKYHEHHLTDEEGYDVYDIKRHRTYAEWAEATVIYEKLIPVLADGPARHKAMKQLAQLYLNMGEHGKARALAEKAPDINCCSEFLMLTTCDGKERAAKYGEIALKLLGLAAELIGDAVAANYDQITIEEAERYIKNAAVLHANKDTKRNYAISSGKVSATAEVGDSNSTLFSHSGKERSENTAVNRSRYVMMLKGEVIRLVLGFIKDKRADNSTGSDLGIVMQNVVKVGNINAFGSAIVNLASFLLGDDNALGGVFLQFFSHC